MWQSKKQESLIGILDYFILWDKWIIIIFIIQRTIFYNNGTEQLDLIECKYIKSEYSRIDGKV